jgi:hypothetical protein
LHCGQSFLLQSQRLPRPRSLNMLVINRLCLMQRHSSHGFVLHGKLFEPLVEPRAFETQTKPSTDPYMT